MDKGAGLPGRSPLASEKREQVAKHSTQTSALADRYATATAISVQAFASAPTVYLATGLTFPDALAGAALAGSQDAPLFIAAGTCIPDAVSRAMTALGASRVVLLGGTPALSSAVGSFQRC